MELSTLTALIDLFNRTDDPEIKNNFKKMIMIQFGDSGDKQ